MNRTSSLRLVKVNAFSFNSKCDMWVECSYPFSSNKTAKAMCTGSSGDEAILTVLTHESARIASVTLRVGLP